MKNFLDSSKFSNRANKSTTVNFSNNTLKHLSNNKPSQLNIKKNELGDLQKELKRRQEKLINLEEKNQGLVELNRNLIDDLKKGQSNHSLVKKYEEHIRYLKESQQELFHESCEQKQQIKLLQNKIEKYLEGTVEEKNLLREYYNSYFKEELTKEKSKNEIIIKNLLQENDNLKFKLQESSSRRYDNLNNKWDSNLKTSNNLLSILGEASPQINKSTTKYSNEKKHRRSNLNNEKMGSLQLFTNKHFFHGTENVCNDDNQIRVFRRMSSQLNCLENGINKLDGYKSNKKDYNSERAEESIYSQITERKKTQSNIMKTLKSMKNELKFLEEIN